jgi:hypothetical protein
MLGSNEADIGTPWGVIVWTVLIALAVGAVSCSKTGNAKGVCPLRQISEGRTRRSVTVTLVGNGHDMILSRLRVADTTARDGKGNSLTPEFWTNPDSKLGPMAHISVSTEGTSVKDVTIEARLEYWGQPIALHAVFKCRGRYSWEVTHVGMRNMK